MASLLSARRSGGSRRPGADDIHLEATVPLVRKVPVDADQGPRPVVGGPVAAAVGALVAALAGWILMAGIAVVGWLAAEPGSLVGALDVGTQFWLLAHGAGAVLGSTGLTLVPWGATLLFATMLSRFAAFAVRQTREPGIAEVGRVVAVTTVVYLLPVVGATALVGDPTYVARGAVVTALFAAAASAWGAFRAAGIDPTVAWPTWSRAVPRAVLAASLVMLAAGAAAVVTGLVVHLERVEQLATALDTGVAGGIALLVAQMAFAPNLIVWGASYTLGAGFSLGSGTVVTPTGTELGLLPAIPVLGGLPGAGGATVQLVWLAAGVAAGAVAAWCILRARPAARFDETSLVGGLSGAVAGLVFTLLGWLSAGDLGTVRLADVGPRLLPLVVMAVTTMGLSGMLFGLVAGLLRRRPPAQDD